MVGATENVLLVRSRVGGLRRASWGGGGPCWGAWLPLISIRAAARATAGAAITYMSCDLFSKLQQHEGDNHLFVYAPADVDLDAVMVHSIMTCLQLSAS